MYRTEAAHGARVTYVSSWQAFQGPGGGFTTFLRTRQGTRWEVRDIDGVHIAPVAGDELIASLVLKELDLRDHLHICPARSDIWRRYTPPGCGRIDRTHSVAVGTRT